MKNPRCYTPAMPEPTLQPAHTNPYSKTTYWTAGLFCLLFGIFAIIALFPRVPLHVKLIFVPFGVAWFVMSAQFFERIFLAQRAQRRTASLLPGTQFNLNRAARVSRALCFAIMGTSILLQRFGSQAGTYSWKDFGSDFYLVSLFFGAAMLSLTDLAGTGRLGLSKPKPAADPHPLGLL